MLSVVIELGEGLGQSVIVVEVPLSERSTCPQARPMCRLKNKTYNTWVSDLRLHMVQRLNDDDKLTSEHMNKNGGGTKT